MNNKIIFIGWKSIGAACGVTWKTLKTEAIDLESDFYWVDDQLLAVEREILEKGGRLDRWIKVDTRADFMDLIRAKRHLTSVIQKI